MQPLTLKSRWILPIDGPPIEGGSVTVADGRVVAVGAASTDPLAGSTVHDLGDMVLMPGLVNAHTHLEFSSLTAPLGEPGMPLPEWLPLAIADRKRTGRDAGQAIAAGFRESLRCGVTTLGEIATAESDAYQTAILQPTTLLFHEVIGFSAARADSVQAATEARLEEFAGSSQCTQQPSEFRNPKSEIKTGLSPHAPYTVHPELLRRLVDLSVEQNLPVAMHLAESPEELDFLALGQGPLRQLLEDRSMWDPEAFPRGTRPIDYLRQLARASRALAVHGNYLDDEEIAFLAERKSTMAVVYCPRTHGYFGHEPYPLEKMLDLGVRVALGTDSRASTPDLSLLAEAREVARRHPSISPEHILRMATLEGAAALGLEEAAGSITPGKWANLTVIPCGNDCREPQEHVVQGDSQPVATWLQGCRVETNQ